MIPEEMFKNMDELIELYGKMSNTMREMKKALRLAQLLNVAPSDMGVVNTWVREDTRWIRKDRWKYATLHVLREGREEQEFKLADIHIDLWPADIAADYHKQTKL
jgi:hypothetical protein